MHNERIDKLSKIFRHGPVAISRQDYESMPCPMAALAVSDKTMRSIAEDVHAEMNVRYTDAELERLFPDTDSDEAEMCQDEFWRVLEKVAIAYGMKYYEDMTEARNAFGPGYNFV